MRGKVKRKVRTTPVVHAKMAMAPHGITYAKLIIVVDEDVDPFDLQQVIWAMTVRFRPERRF